jgi:hypothetical protein
MPSNEQPLWTSSLPSLHKLRGRPDVVDRVEWLEPRLPGAFLEAVKPLVARDGRLVLTTPNASSLTSLLIALSRREWSGPTMSGLLPSRTGRCASSSPTKAAPVSAEAASSAGSESPSARRRTPCVRPKAVRPT